MKRKLKYRIVPGEEIAQGWKGQEKKKCSVEDNIVCYVWEESALEFIKRVFGEANTLQTQEPARRVPNIQHHDNLSATYEALIL